MSHVEEAFRCGEIIDRPLMWSEGIQIGDCRFKVSGGCLVVPFVVIAQTEISLEPWIEVVFLFQALENPK